MSSFDQAEKIKGRVTEKIARVAIAAGVGLAGCTPTLLRPNEPIETPSQGQALAIGLLNEQSINNLPDGEVKTSFVNELNDIKKDCAEIPGCLTDTIQIYRVNVNDPEEGTNVFSYHFANIDDSEGLRTQILSVTDGKTQEKTEINEDLVAKDTVIEGIPTRVFGYVDDNGNSHYLLVDREVSGKSQFQIYDAEGTSYDVITQNEKEVQAYSSFWSAPGIVEAASLPTNTPTAEATPTEAETPTPEAPITFEKYTFQEGDIMKGIAEKSNTESPITTDIPEVLEFNDTQSALSFLESKSGSKWMPGYYSSVNNNFPEGSETIWEIFSNLASKGSDSYDVLLIPHSENDKVTAIGIERVDGYTYFNYVDNDLQPSSIRINERPDYKKILRNYYNDEYFMKFVRVWPGIEYPNGNCTGWGPRPVAGTDGVLEGFACSTDGKNRFYYYFSR